MPLSGHGIVHGICSRGDAGVVDQRSSSPGPARDVCGLYFSAVADLTSGDARVREGRTMPFGMALLCVPFGRPG
jgi:hypothetical protein